jgi:hypothetical protein
MTGPRDPSTTISLTLSQAEGIIASDPDALDVLRLRIANARATIPDTSPSVRLRPIPTLEQAWATRQAWVTVDAGTWATDCRREWRESMTEGDIEVARLAGLGCAGEDVT